MNLTVVTLVVLKKFVHSDVPDLKRKCQTSIIFPVDLFKTGQTGWLIFTCTQIFKHTDTLTVLSVPPAAMHVPLG